MIVGVNTTETTYGLWEREAAHCRFNVNETSVSQSDGGFASHAAHTSAKAHFFVLGREAILFSVRWPLFFLYFCKAMCTGVLFAVGTFVHAAHD